MSRTAAGIAYDRVGPRTGAPLVFVHAGVADRRMWTQVRSGIPGTQAVIALDLPGFGDSADPPLARLDLLGDLVQTLDELEVSRCHLIGASLGGGLAVELALIRPDVVASLLLSAPGGPLIAESTPELQAFLDAEGDALARGDLAAAVEANLSWWVDGPHRSPAQVDRDLRELVGRMQRRAFEIDLGWPEVERAELEPPALDRLADVAAPTMVLVGGLDMDAIRLTADRLLDEIQNAERLDWPDVAHLPSMERPADFVELLRQWLDRAASVRA